MAGDLGGLALAAPAASGPGSGQFTINAMYVTGPVTAAVIQGDTAIWLCGAAVRARRRRLQPGLWCSTKFLLEGASQESSDSSEEQALPVIDSKPGPPLQQASPLTTGGRTCGIGEFAR